MKTRIGMRSSRPKFATLGAGTHQVRLASVVETDSHHQYDGGMKEKTWLWKDAAPVLVTTFVSVEPGKIGGFTGRNSLLGFRLTDDLTVDEIQSGLYTDRGGYACTGNDVDGYERVVCPEKTARAHARINGMLYAMGIAEGFVAYSEYNEDGSYASDEHGELKSGWSELLANGQVTCEIVIVDDEYISDEGVLTNGLKIKSYRKSKVTVASIVPQAEKAAEEVEEPASIEKKATRKNADLRLD